MKEDYRNKQKKTLYTMYSKREYEEILHANFYKKYKHLNIWFN